MHNCVMCSKVNWCQINQIRLFVLANVGGTLGLCVGASILTLFEFIEFGFMLLGKLLCVRRGDKVGSAEWYAKECSSSAAS